MGMKDKNHRERNRIINWLVAQEKPKTPQEAISLREQWEERSFEELREAEKYNLERMEQPV